MIVAEQGRYQPGETVRLTVASVLQTSAGWIIFGRLDSPPPSGPKGGATPNQQAHNAPPQGRKHRDA